MRALRRRLHRAWWHETEEPSSRKGLLDDLVRRLQPGIDAIEAAFQAWQQAVDAEFSQYATDRAGATAVALGANRDLRKTFEKKAGGEQTENVLIKRLIAKGPATVQVKRDAAGKMRVFRNGQALNEPNAKPDGSCPNAPYCIKEDLNDPQSSSAEFAVDKPLELKSGELFVMGDNRNNSNDSRFIGLIDRRRIVGKATAVAFSFDRSHHFAPRFERFFKPIH